MKTYAFSCFDTEQIKVASYALEELKIDCKVLAETSHVLVIEADESHEKTIQAIAITVSEKSNHPNIPLMYEEKSVIDIGSDTDRIEILGWSIRNGHVGAMGIDDVNNALADVKIVK